MLKNLNHPPEASAHYHDEASPHTTPPSLPFPLSLVSFSSSVSLWLSEGLDDPENVPSPRNPLPKPMFWQRPCLDEGGVSNWTVRKHRSVPRWFATLLYSEKKPQNRQRNGYSKWLSPDVSWTDRIHWGKYWSEAEKWGCPAAGRVLQHQHQSCQ